MPCCTEHRGDCLCALCPDALRGQLLVPAGDLVARTGRGRAAVTADHALVSMRNYVSVGPRGPRGNANGTASPGPNKWGRGVGHPEHVRVPGTGGRQIQHCRPPGVFGRTHGGRDDGVSDWTAVAASVRRRPLAGWTVSQWQLAPGPFQPARQLPLFIAQGRESEQYPVERTCDELRLFHAAGMHVTLRQYPWGDELNPQMLHDMNVWIMEQVTGEPSEPETSEA